MTKPVLDAAIAQKIDEMCELADQQMEAGEYERAAQTYIEAYRLLPMPRGQWQVTPHLCFFWGLAFFKAKQWDTAINSFYSALEYSSFAQNPELHLYIGIAYYHDGKLRNAERFLKKAFQLGGCEVFHDVENKFLEIATRTRSTKSKKKSSRQK